MMNHSAAFIRCYPIPQSFCDELFKKHQQDSEFGLYDDVFDVRYNQRRRIIQTKPWIERTSIEIEGVNSSQQCQIKANFHVHKSNTLILILEITGLSYDKNLLNLLQQCRPGFNPKVSFIIQDFRLSFWELYDWFAVLFLKSKSISKATDFKTQIFNDVKKMTLGKNSWNQYLKSCFGCDYFFANPCIFGCISCVEFTDCLNTDSYRISPNQFCIFDSSITLHNFDSNGTIKFNFQRNNGFLVLDGINGNSSRHFSIFSLQIGILLLVRYMLIMYGQTAAVISDKLLDDRKASAHDFFKQVSDLKSQFVFFQDELNNLSLWNSPELVQSSRVIRASQEWSTNDDLKANQERVLDLLSLTDSIARTQTSSTRKFISVILAVVSVLNLMQLIPIVNDHIVPHFSVIGPPLSLILLLTALIAFKIHKNT